MFYGLQSHMPLIINAFSYGSDCAPPQKKKKFEGITDSKSLEA